MMLKATANTTLKSNVISRTGAETTNNLKRFSNECGTKRNPASQTLLIDFAKEYPEIYHCLWAVFALQPSNSYPSEQFHGMGHHTHYEQTRLGHSNARGRYLMLWEYFRRNAR
jgi:hypothetical protein